MDGIPVTTIVVPDDVAVVGLAHDELLVMMQVTTSPFANVLDVNVTPVPAFEPFTCHWYVGVVPPFVGVAVNVVGSPAQIVLVPAIATLGTTEEVTVIAIPVDVPVVGLAQGELLVMIQVTISPSAKVLDVNTAPVPAFPPFTCH